jgi:hypothetical protein
VCRCDLNEINLWADNASLAWLSED